jgi:FMN-dependent NADH-azoreductase
VSRSRRLADAFLAGLRDSGAAFSVAELDVFAQGHSLDLASRGAIALHASLHRPLTESERHDLAALDLLLDPLLRCDLLVIATPVWNFGPPWRLKQWIDCVALPGKTFRFSAQGPRGLLSCKSVLLGVLGGPLDDLNAMCFAQLRASLALMGASPASEVLVHSLDMDQAQKDALIDAAAADAARLARSLATR